MSNDNSQMIRCYCVVPLIMSIPRPFLRQLCPSLALQLAEPVSFADRASCREFQPDVRTAKCKLEHTTSPSCTHDRNLPSSTSQAECPDSHAAASTSGLGPLHRCIGNARRHG